VSVVLRDDSGQVDYRRHQQQPLRRGTARSDGGAALAPPAAFNGTSTAESGRPAEWCAQPAAADVRNRDSLLGDRGASPSHYWGPQRPQRSIHFLWAMASGAGGDRAGRSPAQRRPAAEVNAGMGLLAPDQTQPCVRRAAEEVASGRPRCANPLPLQDRLRGQPRTNMNVNAWCSQPGDREAMGGRSGQARPRWHPIDSRQLSSRYGNVSTFHRPSQYGSGRRDRPRAGCPPRSAPARGRAERGKGPLPRDQGGPRTFSRSRFPSASQEFSA